MKHLFRFLTKLVLVLTIVCVVLFLWAYFVEPHQVKLEKTAVGVTILPEETRGVRICAFSDTHLGFGFGASNLADAGETIMAEKPDLIVFLGDLYDNYAACPEDEREEEAVIAALSALSAPMGKYAVLGNHDYTRSVQKDIDRILTAGGFTVLYDETVDLPEYGIRLFGAKDRIYGRSDPDAFQKHAGYYNIVLSHEPDVFDEMHGVDLMLAGHTHGGQIRVPFLGTLVGSRYGENYVSGLYDAHGGQVYVTRGLGMTILKLRFLCPPEISVLTVGKNG